MNQQPDFEDLWFEHDDDPEWVEYIHFLGQKAWSDLTITEKDDFMRKMYDLYSDDLEALVKVDNAPLTAYYIEMKESLMLYERDDFRTRAEYMPLRTVDHVWDEWTENVIGWSTLCAWEKPFETLVGLIRDEPVTPPSESLPQAVVLAITANGIRPYTSLSTEQVHQYRRLRLLQSLEMWHKTPKIMIDLANGGVITDSQETIKRLVFCPNAQYYEDQLFAILKFWRAAGDEEDLADESQNILNILHQLAIDTHLICSQRLESYHFVLPVLCKIAGIRPLTDFD